MSEGNTIKDFNTSNVLVTFVLEEESPDKVHYIVIYVVAEPLGPWGSPIPENQWVCWVALGFLVRNIWVSFDNFEVIQEFRNFLAYVNVRDQIKYVVDKNYAGKC